MSVSLNIVLTLMLWVAFTLLFFIRVLAFVTETRDPYVSGALAKLVATNLLWYATFLAIIRNIQL